MSRQPARLGTGYSGVAYFWIWPTTEMPQRFSRTGEGSGEDLRIRLPIMPVEMIVWNESQDPRGSKRSQMGTTGCFPAEGVHLPLLFCNFLLAVFRWICFTM